MHCIKQMTQVDIFYHVMNYTSKGIIDAACCSAFKIKSAERANGLTEDLAKSNYRDPSEALGSNKKLRGDVIELNKMTAIEAKLDALIRSLSSHDRRVHAAHEVGTMEGGEQKCITDERLALECRYQVEEAQYVNGSRSYNFKHNNNLPTTHLP